MMPGMQYEQRVQAPQLPSRYPERNALSPKNSTRTIMPTGNTYECLMEVVTGVIEHLGARG